MDSVVSKKLSCGGSLLWNRSLGLPWISFSRSKIFTMEKSPIFGNNLLGIFGFHLLSKHQKITNPNSPPKTNMTNGKSTVNEDVFLIEKWWIFRCHVGFQGCTVYMLFPCPTSPNFGRKKVQSNMLKAGCKRREFSSMLFWSV